MSGRKPKLISTFAGCGGSSLGYKLAGFKELLAIEWDKHAVETFKKNFPDVEVWRRDIRKITAEEILTACSIKKGELDLLDGSPPCQGFSMSGKRNVNDERNDLFRDYFRLLEGIRPKVFLMENVTGMVKGKMRGRFLEIFRKLIGGDYKVKCKVMNAKYYGVPQSRERLIFLGVRSDLGIEPSFPEPNAEICTAGAALRGIPDVGEIRKPKGAVDANYELIKPGKSLAWVMQRKFGKNVYFNVIKLDRNRPSNTVIKFFSPSMAGLLHWSEKRFLTINELKRLATFPDGFVFTGRFEEQWARIGNAVMPKFMERLASHVRDKVLNAG